MKRQTLEAIKLLNIGRVGQLNTIIDLEVPFISKVKS